MALASLSRIQDPPGDTDSLEITKTISQDAGRREKTKAFAVLALISSILITVLWVLGWWQIIETELCYIYSVIPPLLLTAFVKAFFQGHLFACSSQLCSFQHILRADIILECGYTQSLPVNFFSRLFKVWNSTAGVAKAWTTFPLKKELTHR